MGAQLLKEVATKTDDVAGDGTTTAIVLAQAIVAEGLQNVSAGANPMGVKRGIEKGVEAIVAELEKPVAPGRQPRADRGRGRRSAPPIPRSARSSPTSWTRSARTASSRSRRASRLGLETEYTEGMQFDRGYLSAYFVTNADRMEAVARGPAHPDHGQEDLERQGHAAGARAGRRTEQAAGHHRRGHRRRGARHAGREQAPRHGLRPRRQGAGLRRSPQGDAPRHRRPDRRHGHQRGDRAQARLGHGRGLRPGPPRRRHQGRHDDHRRRRQRRSRSRPA